MTMEAWKPALYQIGLAVLGAVLGAGGLAGGQWLAAPTPLPTITAAAPPSISAVPTSSDSSCVAEVRSLRADLNRAPRRPPSPAPKQTAQ